MIDRRAAAQLLDFGARIGGGKRAEEQLDGAVALYNILQRHGVAYLADEVGMGKTYVALGALALFRHYNPAFRVLVLAPRENIQNKWMKELGNFAAHNVRFADLRNKAIDGGPARPMVSCENLIELLEESLLDPQRDFFGRLTSFSLPLDGKKAVTDGAAEKVRKQLRRLLPWLPDEVFRLRDKRAFKDNVARAMCCALPVFDLVIVDEAHNLKHGFSEGVSARNRNLGLIFGHPDGGTDTKVFRGYGPRARHVLFLSATPIEESYTQLWNQLAVFGKGDAFEELRRDDVGEVRKKEIAQQFLIRRVTELYVGGKGHTKNLYRREWRRGGVEVHDEPIRIEDPRQKLVVALVQKKVSELLGHERFNSSFQIGMLASFESFLETSRARQEEDAGGNFDGTEQTENELEREGIDVHDVNQLARDFRERFGREMPHPKMDALVRSLAGSWRSGEKALVFVRRVNSVKELKRKLDECYDEWLIARLSKELPAATHARLTSIVARYRKEKLAALADGIELGAESRDADHGGHDTFFAWFFRGDGPRGVVSGATVQQRFLKQSSAQATFFEDNHVAVLLGCPPGDVQPRLARTLGVSDRELREGLQRRAARYLSGRAQKQTRGMRVEAFQAAAVEWLKDTHGSVQDRARTVWHERFEHSVHPHHASEAPELSDELEIRTFFTELVDRPALRQRLWPEPAGSDFRNAFRERQLRAQMLASAARLGHAFIDLYALVIRRLGSLEQRAQESDEEEGGLVDAYLDELQRQMEVPLAERGWGAFDELAELAAHFDLILDVNAPDARSQPLAETTKRFGQLLRAQQPVGGMAGAVNRTLVGQFRMPGYPLVLISTDLLQEGEDLHTFCSSVHHYGISWTPSSMEQRIGRIDRVRSQTDRRLTAQAAAMRGEEMLQVYFPHLEDTVEVLQVQRVLERMNVFLRLMHEGLGAAGTEERRIDLGKELAHGRRVVPQITERLETSFPVRADDLVGAVRGLAVGPELALEYQQRFLALRNGLPPLDIEWEDRPPAGMLLGTVRLGERQQPFTLLLHSLGERPSVRCISPVGLVDPGEDEERVVALTTILPIRVCAIERDDDASYDLSVEDEVLLGSKQREDARHVALALRRVVEGADRLEQELLGSDEALATFHADLIKEASRG